MQLAFDNNPALKQGFALHLDINLIVALAFGKNNSSACWIMKASSIWQIKKQTKKTFEKRTKAPERYEKQLRKFLKKKKLTKKKPWESVQKHVKHMKSSCAKILKQKKTN